MKRSITDCRVRRYALTLAAALLLAGCGERPAGTVAASKEEEKPFLKPSPAPPADARSDTAESSSAPAAPSTVEVPAQPGVPAEAPKKTDFEDAEARAQQEDEDLDYPSCQVLLVDHQSGWIGVLYYDEDTDSERKLAFRIDPDLAEIRDILRREVEFTAIEAGATIEIHTTRESGKEEVYEIVTTSISGQDD